MFEDFFLQSETELGPLHSDWFETLTEKASEADLDAADEGREASFCKDEGRDERVPEETPELDSQMFSTPKIFRLREPQTPDSIYKESPQQAQGTRSPESFALPWTDSSPCLFGSAKDRTALEQHCGSLQTDDCFDLLDTPRGSLVRDPSAKRISESLGAQLNPDLSWSSSLNTPSALTPTVILSKRKEESSASFLRDKEVVFVRKLFPSLSKDVGSTSDATLLDRSDQTDGQRLDSSSDDVDGLWKQTVPDAIKDDNVRSTVESVLDGAEDVLSIFFSNSSSSLRRVKTKERVKKRVNAAFKEVNPTDLTADCSTGPTSRSKIDPDPIPDTTSPVADTESPLRTNDFTQWTPLSLSDVPDPKAWQVCTSELGSVTSESVQNVTRDPLEVTPLSQASFCTVRKETLCLDSQLERSQGRSSLFEASPALTFPRKPRKFVYPVQNPFPNKGRPQDAAPAPSPNTGTLSNNHCRATSLNETKHEDGLHIADSGAHLVQVGEATVKPDNPQALGMDHGLDLTQLCKAFAEDFTQEVKLETSPNKSQASRRGGLTLSACHAGASRRRSEVRTRADSETRGEDGEDRRDLHNILEETSGFETLDFTNEPENESKTYKSTEEDHDCPTAVSHVSGVTASCDTGLYSGFTTGSNKVILVPPEAVMKAKSSLDEFVEQSINEQSLSCITEPSKPPDRTVLPISTFEKCLHTPKSGREPADLAPKGGLLSSERPAWNISDSSLCQTNKSGFKTASNKSLTVSSFNFEKAKDIFKDLEENPNPRPSNVLASKSRIRNPDGDGAPALDSESGREPGRNTDSISSLTASQKADVTELCSLLEEADSQYEFTQFRRSKQGAKSQIVSHLEKEWDPDMLAGIDFDDSFNGDIERQALRKPSQATRVPQNLPNNVAFVQSQDKSLIPQDTANANILLTDDSLALRSEENNRASSLKVEPNTREGKSFCLGFKTARGNAVSVSEKCLSKARSLFADLEDVEVNSDIKNDQYGMDAAKRDQNPSGRHHVERPLPVPSSEGSSCHVKPTDDGKSRPSPAKSTATEGKSFCLGFKTAGGNAVSVSEKCLSKAKSLFADLEDGDVNFDLNNDQYGMGTAERDQNLLGQSSNKGKTQVVKPSPVPCSEGSSCHVKPTDDGKSRPNPAKSPAAEGKSFCLGFKTARGNAVSVSEKCLSKAKSLFADLEDGDVNFDLKNDQYGMDTRSAERDQNPSGRHHVERPLPVPSSEGSSCHVKPTDDGKSRPSPAKSPSSPPDPEFMPKKAVTTLSTKESEISKPPCDAASLQTLQEGVGQEPNLFQFNTANCGFSTAGGKKVEVSEKALLRAKKLLNEAAEFEDIPSKCEAPSETKTKNVSSNQTNVHKQPGTFVNDVKMSESLARVGGAEQKTESSSEVMERKVNSCQSPKAVQGNGFKLASGKAVSVSESSIQKSKSIFKDVDGGTDLSNETKLKGGRTALDLEADGSPCKFVNGFKMAGGREVSFSERAFVKSKAFFKDCDPDDSGISPGKGGESSVMDDCREVAESTVHLPEIGGRNKETRSVNTERAAWEERVQKESAKTSAETPRRTSGCGFSTASGKRLSVSAEALQRAEAVLDDTPDASPSKKNFDILEKILPETKTTVPGGDWSFSTASGKRVAVSDKALQKARGLFIGCEMEGLGPDGTKTGPGHEAVQKLPDKATYLSSKSEFGDQNVENLKAANFGFRTASGKGVVVSEKALKEGRDLLAACDDCSVDMGEVRSDVAEKKMPNKATYCREVESADAGRSEERYETTEGGDQHVENLKAPNVGFCTASGKGVSFSKSSLHKALQMFKDCDAQATVDGHHDSTKTNAGHSDILEKNLPETKTAVPGGDWSFSTASGKRVAVSDKALQKARGLFTDCDMEESDGSLLNPPETSTAGPKHKRSLGFSTESGKGVVVSESTEGGDQNMGNQKAPNVGFCTASGKGVSFSKSSLHKAHQMFKDCDAQATVGGHHDSTKTNACRLNILEKNLLETKTAVPGGDWSFSTASGKRVAVSDKALQKARGLFTECDMEEPAGSLQPASETSTAGPEHKRSLGFSTVSGKGVVVSETTEGGDQHVENLKAPNVGFCTASGKGVSFSKSSLHKAHQMFKDCDAQATVDGHHDSTKTNACRSDILEKNLPETKTAVPGGDWSFSTASGKRVAVSDKALQKARGLFTDCDMEEPAGSLQPATSETSTAGPEHKRSLGFSTASGKGVVVSEKALTDARALLAGCDDGSSDMGEVRSSESVQNLPNKATYLSSKSKFESEQRFGERSEIVEGGDQTLEHLKAPNVGFCTASGKGVSVSKSAPQEALQMFKDCDTPVMDGHRETTNTIECPRVGEKCTPQLPNNDPVSPNVPQDDRSLLKSRSLNLNGCTVTQQKYFEQEALACTKALLEDDLNEQSLLGNLEDTGIRERSLEVNKGARKRTPDVEDLTGQPPLKRRLVSEFDQISDGPSARPVRSSPGKTLKDRRVFKYNLQLQPNITHPTWNNVDRSPNISKPQPASAPQKRGAPDRKAPVFAPPFHKNVKPETPKVAVCREASKVSCGFVPPPVKKNCMTACDQVNNSTHKSGNSDVPPMPSPALEDKKNHAEVQPPNQPTKEPTQPTEAERDVLEGRAAVSENDAEKIWTQALELARDVQDMRVRKKKRQTIRPLPGSLYLAKTAGVARISLREAVGYKCPAPHTEEELYQHGVHCRVSQVTSDNAESFRFRCEDFFKREVFMGTGGVQLADGGWLVPDNRGTMGKQEFYRALCDTPGVDPKLISEEWVYNHYRWVVWKRAAMERVFPEVMGGRCLTPEQVLLQLKLRYDTEVDHSRRSALKKIMEKDDTPAKTLVLCVCGVPGSVHARARSDTNVGTTDAKAELPAAVVWLTDGWYSIKTLLDPPLCAMLQKGRLRVGVKVMIHGAELIGSQDACPPLEAPDSLMLKISANSTRPVRWDTKLGFYKDPRPFQLPLSSLYPAGGVVGCVDVMVLRCYPTQWMEKKPGGVFVFRNQRAEEREARRHGSAKQKSTELLISKIQAQFEKEEEEKQRSRKSRKRTCRDVESLQDGEELYDAMESDSAYVEAHLTAQQVEAVTTYRRGVAERRQAELQERVRRAVREAGEAEGGCPDRDVTPVWKLSIADVKGLDSSRVYTLNIWRPSMELHSLLKEGCRFKVYHLATSETRKRSGTANVQFTATKKTQFQHIEVCPEWVGPHFPARQSASFRALQNPKFSSPCGEVDIVGYVVSISDRQGPSPLLYLVDEKFDFVSVRSSSSLVQLALEDLVKPSALLAVSNLHVRQLCGPVPSLYAGEQALYSINPKDAHLQEAMGRLKVFAQSCETFFSTAEAKLSNLLPPANCSSLQPPRTPALKPSIRTNVTPQQQSRVLSPFTPVSKKTPAPAVPSETKDSKSLKRKRGMDYLSRVPSPPPLPSLGMVTSPSVNKTFNPPRRCETPRLPRRPAPALARTSAPSQQREEEAAQWVKDEELAMINTQALLKGLGERQEKGLST